MSPAIKKQRNREYYLKNREKILTRARERNEYKKGGHLEIVPELKNVNCEDSAPEDVNSAESDLGCQGISEIAVQPSRAWPTMPAPAGPSNTEYSFRFKNPEITRVPKAAEPEMVAGKDLSSANRRRMSPSFLLRLLLVTGLTLLMTAMQVEFYREHDILPEYAVPLALASEVAFLSLASMKFRQSLDWLRIFIQLAFLGYFASALSFHVYAKSRIKAESRSSVSETTEIKEQLKQAENSLAVATKGRAWKNMEIFGDEVSRLRKQIAALPSATTMGMSLDQSLLLEAFLLILLRGLLLMSSVLNATRLRDQLEELT